MDQKKNLKGKKIVLTRNKEQSEELRTKLEALGAQVIELPLIKILPFNDVENTNDVFSEFGRYEWIIFTSRNGVHNFFNLFFSKFKDIRCIGGVKIACIGQGTAAEVEKYHLEVDFIPKEAQSENLADELIEYESMENTEVLVITGNLNREFLVETLEHKGQAIVDTLQVYETQLEDLSNNEEAKEFRQFGADAIVFSSSSAVTSFINQVKSLKLASSAKHPLICSIGPMTSQTIKDAGLSVNMEAKNHTIEGIVDILLEKLGN